MDNVSPSNLSLTLTIDLEPKLQAVRTRDFLFGHDHVDRTGSHEALSQNPGQPVLAFVLHVSGSHVQA